MPCSARVGVSGSAGVRASPVTAIGRILLARMCGLNEARLGIAMSVTPASRS